MTTPLVSIVVPCYKALPQVYQLAQSLIESCPMQTTQIILSDDACPEYILPDLPFPPGITVRRNETNMGFAANVNAGVQDSIGEFVFILNQDCRALPLPSDDAKVARLLSPGWLDRLLNVFNERGNVGMVAPRLLFSSGNVQSVGGLFGGDKSPFHRFLHWANPEHRNYAHLLKVSWATGAAFMMRRADWDTLGGFRAELYPGGYFEDVDLCMRLRLELHKDIYYCPDATLIHNAGSTGGNPGFKKNSLRFHALWDDAITIDVPHARMGY